jgi:hypothetical protein
MEDTTKRWTESDLISRILSMPIGPDKDAALTLLPAVLAKRARVRLLMLAEPIQECTCANCQSLPQHAEN